MKKTDEDAFAKPAGETPRVGRDWEVLRAREVTNPDCLVVPWIDAQEVSQQRDALLAEAERLSNSDITVHPSTRDLVERFSRALLEKLAAAELKYGYGNDWESPDWMDDCREHLHEHVEKGDPRDVAAYCAFLWYHGERTSPPAPRQATGEVSEGPESGQ